MIGLGSNRLTVCRRGGMSVTQAGKGGMEWLAGGRMPRWSSPYSDQATAALRAQFPTQWATIRDYGFAHPEIVGYMNAYAPEDAKIAYSLVEGIGTRWLNINGSGTITMPITYNTLSDSLYAKYQRTYGGSHYDQLFGAFGSICIHCYWWRAGFNSSYYAAANQLAAPGGKLLESLISRSDRWLKADGEILARQTTTYNTSTDLTSLWLFTDNGGYSYTGRFYEIKIEGAHFNWIVPIIHNGVSTLVNLATGEYGTNSGSFTISETPAS